MYYFCIGSVLELVHAKTLTVGDNLTLVCSGVIDANITWYYNGKLLTKADDVLVNIIIYPDINRRNSVLTVLSVEESDTGYYQCVDEASILRKSTSARVSVHTRNKGEQLTSLQ